MKKRGLESYIISRKERVPLAEILIDPENVRDKYSRESLLVLGDSIARNGQLQPVLIECVKGGYHLVSGHRRYWASRLAKESGWMKRDYMLAKVVSKLPDSLRLRVQCAENECKEPVPKDNLANIFWARYKISLVDQLEKVEGDEIEAIYSANDFLEIPKELRENLSISTYARNIGFPARTVQKAISYQRLNKDIQKQVANPKNNLGYSAAYVLSRIEDKNDQETILRNVRRDNIPTRYHINEAVKKYFEEKRREEETGSIMEIEGQSNARVGSLKELSVYLGQAERLVRVLKGVDSLVGNVGNLELKVDGDKTTPKRIVNGFYRPFNDIHKDLLKDNHYGACWNFVPKRSCLEDFIANYHKKSSNSKKIKAMDLVESKVVSINEVIPNPRNPRGETKTFNKESLEDLADSIKEDGLIHDVLVMKGKKYVTIEGHRRIAAMKLLAEKGEKLKVGILIIPLLSEEQQISLMCDTDLFEQVSLDARSRSIARQYVLEKKEKEDLEIKDFIKDHRKWSPKFIRDSIAYDSLPEAVKKLQSQGIITYGAAIEISKIEGSKAQRDFAVSAAILEQSEYDLKKIAEGDNQKMLFKKEFMDEMRRQAELRVLATELSNNLEGVQQRMEKIMKSERLLPKFKSDDYLFHRFQSLMRTLQKFR